MIRGSHQVELLIHWKGWEETDRTWESAEGPPEDIPNTVLNYLRSHATESDVIDDLVATLDKSDQRSALCSWGSVLNQVNDRDP